jgi:hypothetical protein
MILQYQSISYANYMQIAPSSNSSNSSNSTAFLDLASLKVAGSSSHKFSSCYCSSQIDIDRQRHFTEYPDLLHPVLRRPSTDFQQQLRPQKSMGTPIRTNPWCSSTPKQYSSFLPQHPACIQDVKNANTNRNWLQNKQIRIADST